MGEFFKIDDASKLYLYIKVTTGATENSINPPSDRRYSLDGKEYLKINIKSPPVDGKANKMIIAYLSDLFKISKSQIEIIRGHRSKFKTISLSDSGILKKELLERLS